MTWDELDESLSEGSASCGGIPGDDGRREEKVPGRRYVEEFILAYGWVLKAREARVGVRLGKGLFNNTATGFKQSRRVAQP